MKRPPVVVTPATREDFEELSAKSDQTPAAPPVRVLAISGKVDGRVVAIGGIAFWPNGMKQAFADIGPEVREYPVAIHKAGLAVIKLARQHKIGQLRAVAQEPKEVTVPWLLRLGFVPVLINDVINYVLDL